MFEKLYEKYPGLDHSEKDRPAHDAELIPDAVPAGARVPAASGGHLIVPGRRFLILRGWLGDSPQLTPAAVDEERSCDSRPSMDDAPGPACGNWHLVQDREGRRIAIRCPRSLKDWERGRIVYDNPPGEVARQMEAESRHMKALGKKAWTEKVRNPTQGIKPPAPEEDGSRPYDET